jgi:hypothetical protein
MKLQAHSADLQFVIGIHFGARQGLNNVTPGREVYLWRIARRYRDALPRSLSPSSRSEGECNQFSRPFRK